MAYIINHLHTRLPYLPAGSAAAPTPAAEGGEGEGEEDEGPKKFESEIATNEEGGTVLFKCKSKFLHLKKDADGKSSWDTKGLGLLMVRVKDDPKKPFITFTTEAVGALHGAGLFHGLFCGEWWDLLGMVLWGVGRGALPALALLRICLPCAPALAIYETMYKWSI